MQQKPTRGERNNNPGNIRISSANWNGKAPVSRDSAFETFDTPRNGIRALAKLLRNYQLIHGLDTIGDIIDRWAPDVENDTNAYVAAVCGECEVGADVEIDLKSEKMLARLTKAIIRHENGRVIYSDDDILAAVREALR